MMTKGTGLRVVSIPTLHKRLETFKTNEGKIAYLNQVLMRRRMLDPKTRRIIYQTIKELWKEEDTRGTYGKSTHPAPDEDGLFVRLKLASLARFYQVRRNAEKAQECYHTISRFWQEKGDYRKAAAVYGKAGYRNKGDRIMQQYLWFRAGDLAKARDAYDPLIRANEQLGQAGKHLSETQNRFARYHDQEGEYTKAAEYYKKANELYEQAAESFEKGMKGVEAARMRKKARHPDLVSRLGVIVGIIFILTGVFFFSPQFTGWGIADIPSGRVLASLLSTAGLLLVVVLQWFRR